MTSLAWDESLLRKNGFAPFHVEPRRTLHRSGVSAWKPPGLPTLGVPRKFARRPGSRRRTAIKRGLGLAGASEEPVQYCTGTPARHSSQEAPHLTSPRPSGQRSNPSNEESEASSTSIRRISATSTSEPAADETSLWTALPYSLLQGWGTKAPSTVIWQDFATIIPVGVL